MKESEKKELERKSGIAIESLRNHGLLVRKNTNGTFLLDKITASQIVFIAAELAKQSIHEGWENNVKKRNG